LLNEIFTAFDQLTEQNGLEKIKTIGDAYMVVGGIPMPRSDHAEAIAEMALDMQQEVAKFNAKHSTEISIRIGINTGPVVAGVIGSKKFIYDLAKKLRTYLPISDICHPSSCKTKKLGLESQSRF
jgi:class 3 adenylate cyclase